MNPVLQRTHRKFAAMHVAEIVTVPLGSDCQRFPQSLASAVNRDGLGEALVVDIGRSQQHMHAASTHL